MWRYRCDQCATTSLPVTTRAEVLAERDDHRRRMHGGHVPDGEHLQRTARLPVDRTAVIALAVLTVLVLVALALG